MIDALELNCLPANLMLAHTSILCLFSRLDDYWRQRDDLVLAGYTGHMRLARYSREVVQYLSGVGVYADRNSFPMPSMLLVDLSDHIDVRLELLQHCRLAHPEVELAVAVSSPNYDLLAKAEQVGVTNYILKPT